MPAAEPEAEPRPDRPSAAATSRPSTRPPPRHARAQPPSAAIRPEPGAGAARLLGEDAIVPLEQRGTLEVWGPRLVASCSSRCC